MPMHFRYYLCKSTLFVSTIHSMKGFNLIFVALCNLLPNGIFNSYFMAFFSKYANYFMGYGRLHFASLCLWFFFTNNLVLPHLLDHCYWFSWFLLRQEIFLVLSKSILYRHYQMFMQKVKHAFLC